jgi:integrase
VTARRRATAGVPAHDPSRPRPAGLLEKLVAAVRPEFRSDVIVIDASNPMFGPGPCAVAGCGRIVLARGLCRAHWQRWDKAGRPDLALFVTETKPVWRRYQPNAACRVPGCRYSTARQGICELHAQQWKRSGRTDLTAWLADPPPVRQPPPGVTCEIKHCNLWPQGTMPFCHSHQRTWRDNGRPDVAEFINSFASAPPPAEQVIKLDSLPPQLRLELQYVLQCRYDERRAKIWPQIVSRVVHLLCQTEVASFTDYPEPSWRQRWEPELTDPDARAFLRFAVRKVADLVANEGWEAEYPRDIWQMRRLGYPGSIEVRFTGITQSWLRDLAKRWVRWRLSSGINVESGARAPVRAITRLSGFLNAVGITRVTAVDRALLERYMADVHTAFSGGEQRAAHIGQLRLFLTGVHQHRWEPRLPTDAVLHLADLPRRPDRLPRALAGNVMAQLEHPTNLDRWDNGAYRLITLILMRCGLRISDATRLSTDCIITDAEGAAYLRYFNHKMKREALVPIDEELHGLINEQRRAVEARWPATARCLFPRQTKNVDGTQPMASSIYRQALKRWLHICEIRDERGRPVRVTPHQWRHTLGTTLINKDVPQEVVRRILDHDSPQMTAHYARLHDSTVRRHWERARKVNIHGAEIVVDPAGPLADASWAKQRLGRATQALPNGFCGLPVQKNCPHANACLTCPMFITTAEFLPQHRQQHQRVLQIIGAAEARGQTRLTQMNQEVASNLEKIITALESGPERSQGVADAS